MKHGIFSASLYREALRQTRALGIVMAALAVFGVLSSFAMTVSTAVIGQPTATATIVDMPTASPFLFTGFLLSPLMTIMLFHFLDKREQCDFYHVLPHTRTQLAGSFLAALLTWSAGSVLVSCGLAIPLYTLFPGGAFLFNWSSALHTVCAALAIHVLLIGGTFLAMSLTGTLFSGILGTLLILFVPRILLSILNGFVMSSAPIIALEDLPMPLSPCNLLANLFNLFGPTRLTYHAPFSSVAYTFGLGLVYGALGTAAFVRRKSEAAGTAAVSRGAQALFRTLATLPALFFTALLVLESSQSDAEAFEEIGIVLVIAFALCSALGVFLVFEVITTRTAKRLFKILPTFGIAIVITVLAGLGAHGLCRNLMTVVPTADDIQSVTWLPSSSSDIFMADVTDYFGEGHIGIEWTDATVCETVADALEAAVTDGTAYSANSARVCIRLKDGGKLYRQVGLSPTQVEPLESIYRQNDQFLRHNQDLPDVSSGKITIASGAPGQLTPAQCKELYTVLRKEIKACDPHIWQQMLSEFDSSIGQLDVTVMVGTEQQLASLPISPAFPQSARLCMQFVNENADLKKWEQKFPLTMTADSTESRSIDLIGSDGTPISFTNDFVLSETDAAKKEQAIALWNEAADFIRSKAGQPVDPDRPYARVALTGWSDKLTVFESSYGDMTLFIPLDEAGVPDVFLRAQEAFETYLGGEVEEDIIVEA